MEMTPRLKKLRDRLFNLEYNDPGIWHFQGINILDDRPELANESLVVRKAYAQVYICENLPAYIKPDELIVGNPNQNSVAWGTVMPGYYTKDEKEIALKHELDETSVWGHHPPEWDKIINQGVSGVKKEVEEALENALMFSEPCENAINEYRAMLIALDGVVTFARRHADAALRDAQSCSDPVRRRELFDIYRACSNVPLNPARNLQEAAQSMWIIYSIVNSGGEYVPLARLDQFLYPYYETDIKTNTISKERAIDIVGSFLIKCNERIIIDTKKAENHFSFGLFSQGIVYDEEEASAKVNETGSYMMRSLSWQEDEDINSEANYNYGQSGNNWLMNCMAGGMKPDGTDGTNDVSYLLVELIHDMKLLMPTLAARIHKGTPRNFLKTVAEALRYGQGEPMIYNDDAIIPGLVELGIPVEDARDYTNDGCWEVLVPGKSHFTYAHVMNLQCLEWVLFRGVTLSNDEMQGIDTGDPLGFKDFDEFYSAYRKQVNARIDFQCQRRLDNFGLSYMIAPDPLFSSITKDCVEKGKDISQDGARYIFHLILITGLSNTVDSLAVINKLVYEDKTVKLEELIQALKDNWQGHEKLRIRVMNTVPKFGNDNDYADNIAVKLLKDFEEQVLKWREKQNKLLFPVGIGTFENYAALGRDTGASADGREAGGALSPNYSPSPGMDKEGPTAVLRSITKPDLLRYYCGCPLDISVNANEFEGDAGIDRMADLIQSFCDLGGQIMTISSQSVKDLEDAKTNPENHQGLRVRMGGLSAYFIAMSPVQQDNIIKRFSR